MVNNRIQLISSDLYIWLQQSSNSALVLEQQYITIIDIDKTSKIYEESFAV